jgi:hypothetical protein
LAVIFFDFLRHYNEDGRFRGAVASRNVDIEYVVSRRKWVSQRNVERLSLEISCGDTRAFLKIVKGRGLDAEHRTIAQFKQ